MHLLLSDPARGYSQYRCCSNRLHSFNQALTEASRGVSIVSGALWNRLTARVVGADDTLRGRGALGECVQHGGPTSAGPSFDGAVGDAEHLGDLGAGEALHMMHDHGRAVLGPDVAQGYLDLPPAFRVERGLLGISVARRLREMGRLLVDLARPAARLFASEAQAGVDRHPVEPGRKGAVPPEALHVRPDIYPDLLARVLGVFHPEYAKRHPVHEGGMGVDQLRERLYVAAGGAGDQSPLFCTHRRSSSLSGKRRSRQVSIALHGLQDLAQQATGEFLAARVHDPVDPVSSR